ncbi:hmc operon protein 5 [Pseudodesulfovibrio mercurii]|uniref:Hmc operon protein 5 n=1 Tax=Pseudodesulfovibrio mercurii TaxID=641491 RepID=F0JEM3_9BACT|nr:respiratory nitrate reductase subunit gamma [Pseudodesulfovibrio mercurii]EGB14752.1 hmc operon protein 5 [Pseudodesulfovibrio mercurii]
MYDFLTGPMLWATFIVSLGGLLVRTVMYVKGLNWQLDRVAYRPNMKYGIRGGVRSILAFIIPFKARLWQTRPGFTLIFFAFHIGLLVTPVFLEAHNVMFRNAFGFSLPALPTGVADGLAWVCLVGALFLLLRRIAFPEVRILTTVYDYLLLVITVMPFITGLIARYEMGNYDFWLAAHIISGEIWLLALPFTKLSHVALFFMSRMQLGMDYGIKRGGMKGTDMAW